MNTFAHALTSASVQTAPMGATANGGAALATSGHALTNLFFVVGASRGKDIHSQFMSALEADPVNTIAMLFWARDVRGGAGERDTFRKLMCVLEKARPDLIQKVISLIPVYGRWDDGYCFQSASMQALWFQHVDETLSKGERAQRILNSLDQLTEEECEHLLADIKS
jgi:hypothetical protein